MMKKREMSLLDYIIYGVFILLLVYLFLKLFGVIKSPQPWDIGSYILAVIAGLGIYSKLDKLEDRVTDIGKRLVAVETELKIKRKEKKS